MMSIYIFEHGFKPFVEPSLDQKLNALLFENQNGGLTENLLYESLRNNFFLVFLCPLSTFSFYFLFRPRTDLDGKLLRVLSY